jgi:hypothetical protein
MGCDSIVTGYIQSWGRSRAEQNTMDEFWAYNQEVIATYPFDTAYPFTNIFWCDSPAQYFRPLIGFVGSYKQIEEYWSEWLWKFAQLLSNLEAYRARVYLNCVMGHHFWELEPESVFLGVPDSLRSLRGEKWGIVKAPENDFSIDPSWLATHREKSLWNVETGQFDHVVWDKYVERWL